MEIAFYVFNKEKEAKVTQKMVELGIPANIVGYNYIRTAILIAMENPKMLENLDKYLYPDIAKFYNTKARKVECGIRKAIERTFKRNPEHFNKFFNETNWTVQPPIKKFLKCFIAKM